MRLVILLVNDDGIAAAALPLLADELARRCALPVLIVAPSEQRSGFGHAITIHRPLCASARTVGQHLGFAVDGTPADCVKLALAVLCDDRPPRLVVSGVNHGPNVGRSLFYSGTVGAALEAAIEGVPALAVSLDETPGRPDWPQAARVAAQAAAVCLAEGAFTGLVVNCNLPPGPQSHWREARLAEHGLAGFREGYRPVRQEGAIAWQLDGRRVEHGRDEDAALLRAGHPVVTLLVPQLGLRRPRHDRRLAVAAQTVARSLGV
jgi:5'-nucleotidase